MNEPKRYAPKGAVWVCAACGKTARDRYGHPGEADRGWDESCMLNSQLYEEASLVRRNDETGRVVEAKPWTSGTESP